VAVAYYWMGSASIVIGLLGFMLYELFAPPPRYRIFGPGQAQEAIDNRCGHFGKSYPELKAEAEHLTVAARNEPCPCGSGLKFKRCCGREMSDAGTLRS
jgi:hypothetical protein